MREEECLCRRAPRRVCFLAAVRAWMRPSPAAAQRRAGPPGHRPALLGGAALTDLALGRSRHRTLFSLRCGAWQTFLSLVRASGARARSGRARSERDIWVALSHYHMGPKCGSQKKRRAKRKQRSKWTQRNRAPRRVRSRESSVSSPWPPGTSHAWCSERPPRAPVLELRSRALRGPLPGPSWIGRGSPRTTSAPFHGRPSACAIDPRPCSLAPGGWSARSGAFRPMWTVFASMIVRVVRCILEVEFLTRGRLARHSLIRHLFERARSDA